ncbi:MAG: Sir2 family NAD-dependent protein deacetylase [Thermodesulfobacteriota bacterium]
MPEDIFDKTIALLKQSHNAVALTGAGVSTESGIPDFRGKNGLWSRYDPFEYGTMGAFLADPEKVWQMLASLLRIVNAEPNTGHKGMAILEKKGMLTGIITQNIDGLHQKGGSKNVVEFHGSLDTFSCLACGESYSLAHVKECSLPPHCAACDAILKPDIVFFDELIPDMVLVKTQQMLATADLLLVAGTSCQVEPAARIPHHIHSNGGKIIEINKEPTLNHLTTITLEGNFSTVLGKLVDRLAQ